MHEKNREGTQSGIDQHVGLVLALPGINKSLESAAYQSRDVAHGQGKAAKGCAHCVYYSVVNSATLPDNRQNENCWAKSDLVDMLFRSYLTVYKLLIFKTLFLSVRFWPIGLQTPLTRRRVPFKRPKQLSRKKAMAAD